MREELFGPIVTAYVYDETQWDETLELVDRTARTRSPAPSSPASAGAIDQAHDALRTRPATST